VCRAWNEQEAVGSGQKEDWRVNTRTWPA